MQRLQDFPQLDELGFPRWVLNYTLKKPEEGDTWDGLGTANTRTTGDLQACGFKTR